MTDQRSPAEVHEAEAEEDSDVVTADQQVAELERRVREEGDESIGTEDLERAYARRATSRRLAKLKAEHRSRKATREAE